MSHICDTLLQAFFKDPSFQLLVLAFALALLFSNKLIQFMVETRVLYLRRKHERHIEEGLLEEDSSVDSQSSSKISRFSRGFARKKKRFMMVRAVIPALDFCSHYIHHNSDMSSERLEYRLSYITDRYADHAFYWQFT